MKFYTSLLSSVLLLMSASAWSATPCKTIEAACKAQGYYQGGASSGKGLMMNCIKPITEGKTIEGVKVDPSVISGCKEKLAGSGY